MLWLVSLALGADCATVDGEQLVVPTPFVFASRSAELGDDAPVKALLCALEADPQRTVQIEVHTDSMGSGSYNLRMSQARADSIREAIRALGVAEGRVTSVGYGETMPIAPNTTAEGRATNRRIELHLAPPSERPPSPQPEPGPAPAPAPAPAVAEPSPPKPLPPTLCEEIDQAVVLQESRTWAFPPPAERWVAEVQQCVGSGWDVDATPTSLYAHRPGWALSVAKDGAQVDVALKRE